tara:strand:- start:36 stop:422 length:387 start_codon:yes stop_codon:yes gene_type:complete
MQYEKNPLTPHLEIYTWHISSLLSITHRIVGIINLVAITLICLGVIIISALNINYDSVFLLANSFLGKFISLGLSWTFSYHILNEIRHLAWDLGYGFDLKTSNLTGILTIFGSFILSLIIYFVGKGLI